MRTSYFSYQIPLLLLFGLFSISTNAQYITIDNSKTPAQLVQELFSSESCVSPTNVSISGWDFGNGKKSYAWFVDTSSRFPLAQGMIISTGKASSAAGPNTTLLSEGPENWPGDSDLERAIGENNTTNATIVEFDFVSVTNYISFNYIFSSEHYLSNPNSDQCNTSDGFAFLIKKTGTPTYQNLGVVPGTNIPVKVTTVRGPGTICPPANPEYFDAFNTSQYSTNFNGQTQIMNAEADIEPGASYHVKLVIADQGNTLYDSAIFIGANTLSNDYAMGDDRLFADGNPLCPGETLTVAPDYTVPGTLNYTWYKNNTPIPGHINVSSPSYTISSAGVYKLVADVGTCIVRGYMNVEYVPTASDAVLAQCDDNNDGISLFNLNNATQTITAGSDVLSITGYYHNLTDAQNQQSAIDNPESYSNSQGNTIVVRVENDFGCPVDYATITLQTVDNAVSPIAPVIICDSGEPQDGFYPFDLDAISQQIIANNSFPSNYDIKYYASFYDALLEIAPLSTPFTNTVANQQIIYARIINGPDCYGIIPITLKVSSFPELHDETVALCNGESSVLDAGSGYSSYSWDTTPVQNTQTITVSESGDYTITVTNEDNCVASKTFTVITSEIATIINIEVNSFSGTNNSVIVHVSGNGNYEYSLDGIIYQDSNVFTNVLPGEYQVYVRDKNGCGTVGPQHIIVLDYPRFFTPNGDGYNDIWAIKNLDSVYPNSKLYIFDRYGKLIKHVFPLIEGWNGTLNNSSLPSDDYWFTLTLDNGRNITGHFALKR